MSTLEEKIILNSERTLLLTTRTLFKSLLVAAIFLVVPVIILAGVSWNMVLVGVSLDSSLCFTISGTAYFGFIWHLFPTKYKEIIVYSLLISMLGLVAYILANNHLVQTSQTEIISVLFTPWIAVFPATLLYFPVKYGFDRNVSEEPLKEDEEGLYSRNRILRYLQIHYELPSLKPRMVLLTTYIVIYSVLVAASPIWMWIQEIRI